MEGGGFWHETYRLRGGMEAIYLDMPPTGFGRLAPERAGRTVLQGAPADRQLKPTPC